MVVQGLGVVESFAALCAFVAFLAFVLASDVIDQHLLDLVRDFTHVALEYRIDSALVHLFLVRLK